MVSETPEDYWGEGGNKCKILVNHATKNVPKEKKNKTKRAPAFTIRMNKKQTKKKYSDDRKPVGRDGESTDRSASGERVGLDLALCE